MLKVGIIGLGDIAQKAYLPVISSLKETELEIHLYTRNAAKLKEISQQYRYSQLHANLASLINSGITAALVHSSTESHYEIVKKLLLQNIHVYVDKPITYHYETVKELTDLAQSRNLILMTGFNRRFAPAYQTLREVTEPNMIVMQKNRHSLPDDIRTFVFDDYIHVIDTVRYLFPYEIEHIVINGRKKGDLISHIVVQLIAKEMTGIAIMNRDSGTVEERLEIMGPREKRSVVNLVDQVIHLPNKETRVSFRDWDPTLYKRGFVQIVGEFIQAVQTNKSPSITPQDALQTHELCERIAQYFEEK